MTALTIFLQALPEAAAATPENISIFGLLMKGGWVMVPLLILFAVMAFVASDSWFSLRKMNSDDRVGFSDVIALVREGQYDKALGLTKRSGSSLAGVIRAGIENRDQPVQKIEEDMQIEARQAIARMEAPVGYLALIASIAPMLGFLGTIFGVITIFMNISATNELSISSISDGLYQKMICSGVGLLEGIISYCAFWLLSRRVDRIVLTMDKGANIFLKALAQSQGR